MPDRRAEREALVQQFLARRGQRGQGGGIQFTPPPKNADATEEYSGVRKYVPMGIRGVGMLLGLTPARGVGASGATEALAQLVEGRFSPGEIGLAALTGGIGGAATKSIAKNIAKPLVAGVKGAGWGALSPVARASFDEDYDLSAGDVALGAGIGGGTAAGLARLGQFLSKAPAASTKVADEAAKEAAKNTGLSRLVRPSGEEVKKLSIPMEPEPYMIRMPSQGAVDELGNKFVSRAIDKASTVPTREMARKSLDEGIMSAGRTGQKLRDQVISDLVGVEKAHGVALSMTGREAEAAKKLYQQQQRQTIIDDLMGRMKRGSAKGSKTYSVPTPEGGKHQVTIPFGAPKKGRGAAGKGQGTPPPPDAPITQPVTSQAPSVAPSAPDAPVVKAGGLPPNWRKLLREKGLGPKHIQEINKELKDPNLKDDAVANLRKFLGMSDDEIQNFSPGTATPSPQNQSTPNLLRGDDLPSTTGGVSVDQGVPVSKLNFYKTPSGAAGAHYGQLKRALGRGEEIPQEGLDVARNARMRLSQEFKAGQAPPDWVTKELKTVEALKEIDKGSKKGGGGYSIGMGLGGGEGISDIIQKHPELAIKLGMGATGALIGAGTSENPALGAAVGGVAGYSFPSMVKAAGQAFGRVAVDPSLPPSIKNILAKIGEGDQEKAFQAFMNEVPQVLRANMLIGPNTANNFFTGPWGSGMTAGSELYMAGDPRGREVLRMMNPVNWAREYTKAWEQAKTMVDDAVAMQGEKFEGVSRMELLKLPARGMLAGDIATRNILRAAGVPEDVARKYTLTSEPVTRTMKALVNVQRSSPLGQVLMPFARTLANIAEQGAARTPLLGKYVQKTHPELAYAPNVQHAQQVLGTAIPLATGALGYYVAPEETDPGSTIAGRFLRSAVSNVAGPYSGLATIGFGVGKALQSGEEGLGDIAAQSINEGLQTIPLPTTGVGTSYSSALRSLLNLEAPERVPTGLVPLAGAVNPYLQEYVREHQRPRRASRTRKRPQRD